MAALPESPLAKRPPTPLSLTQHCSPSHNIIVPHTTLLSLTRRRCLSQQTSPWLPALNDPTTLKATGGRAFGVFLNTVNSWVPQMVVFPPFLLRSSSPSGSLAGDSRTQPGAGWTPRTHLCWRRRTFRCRPRTGGLASWFGDGAS